MSMIKISCPSCKAALKIAEEKLTETQGRVVCHECQHIFRLVKKAKKHHHQHPPNPLMI
nr:zinc-ribbon domain-containing protein [Alysiella crassa]UOP06582.1 zinc-ribbon domain-containing protein [Alysiella crassa]